MGVDHTAFAFYGVRINSSERDHDKIDEAIPSRIAVGLVDWGSRPYGGQWGYALTIKRTYSEVDFDRGVGIRALPGDSNFDRADAWLNLKHARDALKEAGIECEFDGEPGWFVGGRTW